MKRLKKEKAPYIKLDLDTVVFENDSSQTREGCSVTYKRVKGFQPLMMKWNGYVVSTDFREGKAHSNHGDDALNMILHVVSVIRKAVSVPIILTADGGFFDQRIMSLCESLKIGYIIGGKQYRTIRERVQSIPEDEFSIFKRENDSLNEWYYTEFMDKRDNWDTILPAYSRCVRITRDLKGHFDVSPDRFVEKSESELYNAVRKAEAIIAETNAIDRLMDNFLPLIPTINKFFDGVLVMADDEMLRSNRLGILQRISGLTKNAADLSYLEGF